MPSQRTKTKPNPHQPPAHTTPPSTQRTKNNGTDHQPLHQCSQQINADNGGRLTVSWDSKLGPNSTTAGWLAIIGTVCWRLMVPAGETENKTREKQQNKEAKKRGPFVGAGWLSPSGGLRLKVESPQNKTSLTRCSPKVGGGTWTKDHGVVYPLSSRQNAAASRLGEP